MEMVSVSRFVDVSQTLIDSVKRQVIFNVSTSQGLRNTLQDWYWIELLTFLLLLEERMLKDVKGVG